MAKASDIGVGLSVTIGILVTVVGTVLATLTSRHLHLQDSDVKPVVAAAGTVPPRLIVPKFIGDIERGKQCHELEEFLAKNRGKLVEISVHANTMFSSISVDSSSGSLSFRSDADGDTSPAADRCSDFSCYITGAPYSLNWYKTGHHRFTGFFVIARDVSWHQGQNFALRAVPPEYVLLQTQRETTPESR